jgi:hypothetical protein
MMNYEIKSTKEANKLEIFFDKNTNKLSYKNSKGIVTSIDTANDLLIIQNDLTALEATVNALPAAPTTTVVIISSEQILAMGTTPIELLPPLLDHPNSMYDYSVILSQNNALATTGALFGVSTRLWVGDNVKERGAGVSSNLIINPNVQGLKVPSDYFASNNALYTTSFGSDGGVYLTSFNGSNPNQELSADVTLKAIIKWEVVSLIYNSSEQS